MALASTPTIPSEISDLFPLLSNSLETHTLKFVICWHGYGFLYYHLAQGYGESLSLIFECFAELQFLVVIGTVSFTLIASISLLPWHQ